MWPSSEAISRPLATSHTRAVRSWLAVTTCAPALSNTAVVSENA
jgi:hypothetical protein